MLIFGYARVSGEGQVMERQIQAIKEYRPNIEDGNIFKDTISGKTFDRPQYDLMKQIISRVAHCGEPVELVIEEFDRLGRNKAQVKAELTWFRQNGVILRILNLPTTLVDLNEDTKGLLEMVQNILIEVLGTIAETELRFREKRQREGIEIAKAKGVYKGRKPIDIDPLQFERIYTRWRRRELTGREAMVLLGLKPNTFYRRVHEFEKGQEIDFG